MKLNLAILIFAVISVLAFATTDTLPNLQTPRYEIYTSGQPDEEGYKLAAEMGIKSVINVLPEKDCISGEETIAAGHKMAYNKFPFESQKLNMAMVQRFGVLLQNQKKPVLIHCSTGNHVGGLWFAYRVLAEKAPLAIALKEARAIGMKPEMENAIFDWVIKERDNLHL